MDVEKIIVKSQDPEIIFDNIRRALKKCKDTQIYISKSLIVKLNTNLSKFEYRPNYHLHVILTKDEKGEIWYEYAENDFLSTKETSLVFQSANIDYYQVTEFDSTLYSGKYTYNQCGFKVLLLFE